MPEDQGCRPGSLVIVKLHTIQSQLKHEQHQVAQRHPAPGPSVHFPLTVLGQRLFVKETQT